MSSHQILIGIALVVAMLGLFRPALPCATVAVLLVCIDLLIR